MLGDPGMYAFTGGAPERPEQLAVRYARWVAGATKPGQTWVNLVVRERATGAAVPPLATQIRFVSAFRVALICPLPIRARSYSYSGNGSARSIRWTCAPSAAGIARSSS